MQINITVRNQSIIDICPCVVLAEDSQNYVTAAFTFLTDDWDNTEKTAQFQNPKTGEVYESILDSSNTCTVRWEALSDSGDMNVAVFGVNGGYRVTTSMGVITVLPTLSGGESDTPPSPDVYQQLLTMLGQKADNMTYSDSILRLLSGSKELASVIIAGGGSNIQPDWNQNNSGAADYIKNRPFYDDTEVLVAWDGNTEGLVAATDADGTVIGYRVADYINPLPLPGAATIKYADGYETPLNFDSGYSDTIGGYFETNAYRIDGKMYRSIVFVENDGTENVFGDKYPEKGIYWTYKSADDVKLSQIILNVHRLQNKFLNIDTDLSHSSENPVQNKVVAKVSDQLPLVVTSTSYNVPSATIETVENKMYNGGMVAAIPNGYDMMTFPEIDRRHEKIYFLPPYISPSNPRYVGRELSDGEMRELSINPYTRLIPPPATGNVGKILRVGTDDNGNAIYSWENVTAADVNALAKDNTTEYTPTGDYNPATKKYVDDAVSGVSAATPRQQMQSTDTTATLQPNTLYVFPEMATLSVTLATPSNTDIVNDYMFTFTSGATATTLSLPDSVITDIAVEPNMYYECSIIDNRMVFHEWEVTT